MILFHRVFICFLALTLAACETVQHSRIGEALLENVPEIDADLMAAAEATLEVERIRFVDWAPGEKSGSGNGMIVSFQKAELAHLYHLAKPGGELVPLTRGMDQVNNARTRPADAGAPKADRGFFYLADKDGDENTQIYYFPSMADARAGNAPRLLTDGSSRNIRAIWSPDGSRIAYATNVRNGVDWDIRLASPDVPDAVETVLQTAGTWLPVEFTPDAKKLLVAEYVSVTRSRLVLIDLATGTSRDVLSADRSVSVGAAHFAPDGSALYLTTDLGSTFRNLRRLDLATGEITKLSPTDDGTISNFELTADGGAAHYIINRGGIFTLNRLDFETGEIRTESRITAPIVSGLRASPDRQVFAATIEGPALGETIVTLPMSGGAATLWTGETVGKFASLPANTTQRPELITYPTFDEVEGKPRQIPAFLYTPEGPGPHPVVLFLHGGPESQFLPLYHSAIRLWVDQLNVAVLAPNFRGSAGYGGTYLTLDDGARRVGAVRDIGAALDWLQAQDNLDEDRVVAVGRSYGGFMSLATMVNYGDRIRGAVDSAGIANFVTFLERTSPYRQEERRAEYGDERLPDMREFLRALSPLSSANRINKPLLVFHGVNDPRVPISESIDLIEVARRNGTTIWAMFATDEGHVFRRRENRLLELAITAQFLRTVLELSPTDLN